MKSFITTIFVGLALLTSVSANAINIIRESKSQPTKMPTTQDIRLKTEARKSVKTLAADDAITSPVGTERLYTKDCSGTFRFSDSALFYEDVFSTKLVWGDNNDVYFYNILSLAEADTFVKGTVDGNKIVIDLPQTAYYDEEAGAYVELAIVKYSVYIDELNREAGEYIYCPDFTQITFNVADNGVLTMVIPGEQFDGRYLPDYGLGYVYSDTKEWTGYVDFEQVLTPTEGAINVIPTGTVMTPYTFIYDNHGINVEVGFNNDNMYIRGLNPNFPKGVIVASVEGNTATIRQNQIMGIYNDVLMYLKLVKANPDYDYETDDPNLEYFFAPDDAVYTLQISDDRSTISSVNNEYDLCLNGSPTRLYYLAVYVEINLNLQSSYAGTPKNPSDPYWYDEFNTGGTGSFFFYVYDVSTDGSMLDPNHLYYRIYVDDKIMTFVQEENPGGRYRYRYPQIFEATTKIPYLFMNWQDIYVYADTPRRMVDLYNPDITSVGVQSVYEYEGKTTVSDILRYDILQGTYTFVKDETGIDKVVATPVTKGIYNLMGIKLYESAGPTEINSLPKGIYIINGEKIYVR
ncbi:MAG: hypothetical protein J1E57_10230 [Prevotella sp.]|nr:hypothetical protein [Prevotella sp.]